MAMVIKDIIKNEEAHKRVYNGIKKLAETVGSTFGPCGHPVSLQKDDSTLHCTKDGVSVAREITFADQIEYSATTYIKDIANNTVSRAGDGTTTSILLAWMLYKLGINEKGEQLLNVNPKFIEGMKDAAKECIEFLQSKSISAKDPETLEKVALIASNNDLEISELLKEAMKVLGETGNIYVEESKSTKTKLFTSPGMGLMKGFMSNYFINNSKRLTSDLVLPYVLITEDEIFSIFQLQNLFHQITEYHYQKAQEKNGRLTDVPHILIICKKMKEDVLEWVITQHAFKAIQACVVQAEHIAENPEQLESWMTDLRLITGCQGIGGKFLKRLGTGVAQCNVDDLGVLKKAVINKEKSILIPLPDESAKVKAFCQGLRDQMEEEKDDAIKYALKARISRLSDGVAILSIGGITEKSVKERADRIEDAVCAVMVARETGVLPGGGLPYVMASMNLIEKLGIRMLNENSQSVLDKDQESYIQGYGLIHNGLLDLVKELFVINHRDSGEVKAIYDANKPHFEDPKQWLGVNLRTSETNVNLFEQGVVEPVKVNVEAIQNAVDIISMLLNTNSFVIYADNQEKKLIYPPKGGHGMLPGMGLPETGMPNISMMRM
jgi:chaperonin GroEL